MLHVLGFLRSGVVTVLSRNAYEAGCHLREGGVLLVGSEPSEAIRVHIKA